MVRPTALMTVVLWYTSDSWYQNCSIWLQCFLTGLTQQPWKDGARYTKGWFKVVAPDNDGDDNTFKDYGGYTFAGSDANDENERWYYADGNGELYVGEIKKIKGNTTASHQRTITLL